jgi:hypothetical protein
MDGLGILLAGQGKMDAAERLFRDSLALRQKLNLADETVDFMKAFYARVVQAGETPPAALSGVQRELLVQRREKKGLAAAVDLTAPFVLTSASQ